MEHHHEKYEEVLKLSGFSINGYPPSILLTSKTQIGKSYMCKQIAKHFGIRYGYISGNSQTTKTDLLGYVNIEGVEVKSIFQDFYENGGLLVLEEFDTIPQGVATALNTSIAGDSITSPSGKEIKRHKDFRLFVTTNTYDGANSDYTARVKMDQASLERYYKVDMEIDTKLEKKIFGEEYKIIKWIRENLIPKGGHFSTGQANLFISAKSLGFLRALAMTAFRQNPQELRYSSFKETMKKVSFENLKKYTQEELDQIYLGKFENRKYSEEEIKLLKGQS